MQYYQCKCGSCTCWGSSGPNPCTKCYKCGSNLALGPDSHSEPQDHSYFDEQVETNDGNKPLTRCRWCLDKKADIEKREALYTGTLGLDFGNVIKIVGGKYEIPNAKESIDKLKHYFEDRIYIVSRVDNEEDEKKVLAFLGERGFLTDLIKSENVYFCRKRNEKGPIAKTLGITHFVDDRTECLSYMDSVPTKIALNPVKEQLEQFPPNGMKVAKDWTDILNFLYV